MSTLANTTWIFSTQGALAGNIQFQQVGSSLHSGVATITAINPPVGYIGATVWTAEWAEGSDSNNFTVQFNNFMPTDPSVKFNPPPLGIPTINAGQMDAKLVTLFGSHASGIATVFGTNFQTQNDNGDVVTAFTMTRP